MYVEVLLIIFVFGVIFIVKDDEDLLCKEYFGVFGGFFEDDIFELSFYDFVILLYDSLVLLLNVVKGKFVFIIFVKVYEVELSMFSF